MSISSIKRAFQEGLGDAGSCLAARMDYEKGDTPGQRLSFDITSSSGVSQTVTTLAPHGASLVDFARSFAAETRATLLGS